MISLSSLLLFLLPAVALSADQPPLSPADLTIQAVSSACIKLCNDRIHDENNLPNHLCRSAFNERPKPDAWRTCMAGMKIGVTETCMPTCMAAGNKALVKAGMEPHADFVNKPVKDTQKSCDPSTDTRIPSQAFRKFCYMGYLGAFDLTVKETDSAADKIFGFGSQEEFDAVQLAQEKEVSQTATGWCRSWRLVLWC